ncbi:MAG: hypothetical protein JWP27_898 [Flaviaesturariibacter sp.]|nr:hypothetical protein [Flaviaesturariibacter sp.]
MQTNRRKSFFPIALLFIVINGFFLAGKGLLTRWGADADILLAGNAVLFLITMLSYYLAQKGLKSANTHAFMRGVYSSILLKLFLCAIAAVVYIATYRKAVNKPALFTLMGLYLVYTFVEVSSLTKQLRRPTNG